MVHLLYCIDTTISTRAKRSQVRVEAPAHETEEQPCGYSSSLGITYRQDVIGMLFTAKARRWGNWTLSTTATFIVSNCSDTSPISCRTSAYYTLYEENEDCPVALQDSARRSEERFLELGPEHQPHLVEDSINPRQRKNSR